MLVLRSRSDHPLHVKVADAYGRDRTVKVGKQHRRQVRIPLSATHQWYDVLVTVRNHPHYKRGLAGRFENGQAGTSDPQLGR